MAGQVSEKELGSVLEQAMLAQKNLRPHCDRLLQLLRQLQHQPSTSDSDFAARFREFALDVEHIDLAFADGLHELANMHMKYAATTKHLDLLPDIVKVHVMGIKAGARCITSCLQIAAKNGARIPRSPDFAAMPDEHLYDTLVAQRLPARPTTQTEAFYRLEAAIYAVTLAQEYHLPRCIHNLGIRLSFVTGEHSDEDEPVAAATEHIAPTPANISVTARVAAAARELRQAMAKRGMNVDKARHYLDRACTLVSLAVGHIDLAVAVLSSFLDPKEVASLSESTDRAAKISEDQFLQLKLIK